METLLHLVLGAYDRLIGLALEDLAIDCCVTKAPCGEDLSGRNPVDSGKRSLTRFLAVNAAGIPLGPVVAPASRHDSALLALTLDALG